MTGKVSWTAGLFHGLTLRRLGSIGIEAGICAYLGE